jgi:penicillin-binding protein 1C
MSNRGISHRDIATLRVVGLRVLGFLLCPCIVFLFLSFLFPLPPMKPYSLVVEDRNGRFLHAFLATDGVWRLRTSPHEIPERLRKILVRREDRWFYYHPGVNPLAVVRAVMQNVVAGHRISGASTITMQIARMLEPKERTYLNKCVEIFRAMQLEWKYSKDELLEMYLSIIPLGGNIEGLKSASLMYFQTPLERLNIAQLFDLIMIPSDPNGLQPDRNAPRLFDERKRQALEWISSGLLNREDSAIIWNAPANAVRKPLQRFAPHFCLRIREMFPAATEVRSSLDLPVQQKIETLLSNHVRPWKLKGVHNGAVVVIDNTTREILAYAGSENFDDAGAQGQVDAVRALHSPGSTLKPLLYALLMDRGELTPRTRLLDVPYDAEGFLAENYDGTYSGLVYADDALRRSLNVPMIRLLRSAGVPGFLDFIGNAGVSSLQTQRAKLGLSLILGGCGVTLEEMTGAYSTFPAGGIFVEPRFVKQQASDERSGREVFSRSAAYMVTEILSGLDRPDLPNNFESSMNLPTVAFKTGTSYGRRDAWSIGYSAQYTVGVWIGNVTQRGCPDLVGSKSAAPLLIDIFNSISASHQKTILPIPRDVSMRLVCAESGLVPNGRCQRTIEDLYSVSRTLNRPCNLCMEYLISQDGSRSYCASCAGPEPFRSMTYLDYPAELLDFWRRTGIAYHRVPPHNPLCTRLFPGEGPNIVSPSDAMTYFVVSKTQKLAFLATSGVDVRVHNWYLNNRFLGHVKIGEKLFVHVTDGDHDVTCIDDHGRMSSVHITVKDAMEQNTVTRRRLHKGIRQETLPRTLSGAPL